jgi:hypothetical protein
MTTTTNAMQFNAMRCVFGDAAFQGKSMTQSNTMAIKCSTRTLTRPETIRTAVKETNGPRVSDLPRDSHTERQRRENGYSQGKETAQSGRVNRAHPSQLFVPQSAWPGLASSSHTTKFMNLENPPSDALVSYGNAHQHTYIHTTGRTSDVRSCLRVFAIHVERVVGVCMHICVCRRLDRYARRVHGLAGCGPRLGKGGETVCDDAASTPRVCGLIGRGRAVYGP